MKKTKIETLQFLKFFVETAGAKILPHAIELKSVLLTIFTVDNASDVRASIFPVLSQVNTTTDYYSVYKRIHYLVDGVNGHLYRDAK